MDLRIIYLVVIVVVVVVGYKIRVKELETEKRTSRFEISETVFSEQEGNARPLNFVLKGFPQPSKIVIHFNDSSCVGIKLPREIDYSQPIILEGGYIHIIK